MNEQRQASLNLPFYMQMSLADLLHFARSFSIEAQDAEAETHRQYIYYRSG